MSAKPLPFSLIGPSPRGPGALGIGRVLLVAHQRQRQRAVRHQQHRGQLEHRRRRQPAGEQRLGDARADRAAQRGAERDEREQPLALLLPVEIVGQRPELRDHRQAEDADPDEEGDADIGQVELHAEVEQLQAAGEEADQADDEPTATDPAGQPAVGGHEGDEQRGLQTGGVALGLGAAAGQDERLSDRFQQVIRDHEDEQAGQHGQGARRLVGADFTDEAERALQRRALRAQEHARCARRRGARAAGAGCRPARAAPRATISSARLLAVGVGVDAQLRRVARRAQMRDVAAVEEEAQTVDEVERLDLAEAELHREQLLQRLLTRRRHRRLGAEAYFADVLVDDELGQHRLPRPGLRR